jgi:hypothetical protein
VKVSVWFDVKHPKCLGDKPETFKNLFELGIDILVTDQPQEAQETLKEWQEEQDSKNRKR